MLERECSLSGQEAGSRAQPKCFKSLSFIWHLFFEDIRACKKKALPFTSAFDMLMVVFLNH